MSVLGLQTEFNVSQPAWLAFGSSGSGASTISSFNEAYVSSLTVSTIGANTARENVTTNVGGKLSIMSIELPRVVSVTANTGGVALIGSFSTVSGYQYELNMPEFGIGIATNPVPSTGTVINLALGTASTFGATTFGLQQFYPQSVSTVKTQTQSPSYFFFANSGTNTNLYLQTTVSSVATVFTTDADKFAYIRQVGNYQLMNPPPY